MKKTKFKIRKSVLKRVKITGGGKILRGRSFSRHMKANRKKSQVRRSKKTVEVTGAFKTKVRKILGI
jgi:ribosomal protein L35